MLGTDHAGRVDSAETGADVHIREGFSTGIRPLSTRSPADGSPEHRFRASLAVMPQALASADERVSIGDERVSIGVDELPDGGDLAPELVIRGDLAVDLVAGVEDRRVVAAAELGTD